MPHQRQESLSSFNCQNVLPYFPVIDLANGQSWMQNGDAGIFVNVTVQPRASRNKVVGIFDNTLKIATTSPPVDGKANTHIILLLSKLFKIPKSSVTLKSGQQSRKKRFVLSGISMEEAQRLFSEKINP